MEIRRATIKDLGAVTDIYNDVIVNSVATFDAQPKTMPEQKKWLAAHGAEHPLLVVEIDGQVVGWASLSDWSDRCAYSNTAELSIYIRKDARGRGIGKQLLKSIIKQGKSVGLHVIVARIESSNRTIIHMLERFGFTHIGVMKEVGKKFGRMLDVVLMQLILLKSGF